jgi:hypothetical protein
MSTAGRSTHPKPAPHMLFASAQMQFEKRNPLKKISVKIRSEARKKTGAPLPFSEKKAVIQLSLLASLFVAIHNITQLVRSHFGPRVSHLSRAFVVTISQLTGSPYKCYPP